MCAHVFVCHISALYLVHTMHFANIVSCTGMACECLISCHRSFLNHRAITMRARDYGTNTNTHTHSVSYIEQNFIKLEQMLYAARKSCIYIEYTQRGSTNWVCSFVTYNNSQFFCNVFRLLIVYRHSSVLCQVLLYKMSAHLCVYAYKMMHPCICECLCVESKFFDRFVTSPNDLCACHTIMFGVLLFLLCFAFNFCCARTVLSFTFHLGMHPA